MNRRDFRLSVKPKVSNNSFTFYLLTDDSDIIVSNSNPTGEVRMTYTLNFEVNDYARHLEDKMVWEFFEEKVRSLVVCHPQLAPYFYEFEILKIEMCFWESGTFEGYRNKNWKVIYNKEWTVSNEQ